MALSKAELYEQAYSLKMYMQADDSAICPDQITYNTILLSFCISADPGTAARVAALLQEWIKRYQQQQSTSPWLSLPLSPNEAGTGAAMVMTNSFWIPSPDVVSFNTILVTWTHLETKAATMQAQACLEMM